VDRLRQIGVPPAPALPAPAASTVTGAVVGLLVTALAALALAIFSAVRGTATGGGWGLLALAAILVLAALIDPVYTGWAWLMVPAIGAAACLVAHLLIVALTPGDD